MKKTNADHFRSQLKSWMDDARKQPVKITRKTGESFVLIHAEKYESMALELAQLRGQYQGLLDAFQGLSTPMTNTSIEDLFDSAKSKSKAVAASKRKKAMG